MSKMYSYVSARKIKSLASDEAVSKIIVKHIYILASYNYLRFNSKNKS